eukprot:TRINITY_DN8234_c0_g1_i1.p1 TRINITY_DN8234_c0_g1~~TRINITY_DN8234_c0_g1_i1.p1  ORF type:complete len:198 (-),score=41.19 TRINITY_DN8234_c0_g1_i1:3-596(-)
MYKVVTNGMTCLKKTTQRRITTCTIHNPAASRGYRNWCWSTPTVNHYRTLKQINTLFGRTYVSTTGLNVKIPDDRKYTKSHEWIKIEEGRGTVGITSHASEALGDIVFVELPEVGRRYEKSDPFAAVESVKAASDIYIPVGGSVEEVNAEIENTPNMVNESPFEKGWLVKISVDDEAQYTQLMNHEEYGKWLEDEKK